MKVKRSKASDLAESLKHLKISDRRFRPQLKGSTLHTLASLSEVSSSCRYNFRMTRSASSATVISYGFRCCKACEYCQAIRKAGTESEVIDNNSNQENPLYPCLSEHSNTSADCSEDAGSFLEPPTSSIRRPSGYLCTTLPPKPCHSNYRTVACDLHPLHVSSSFEPTHLHRSYGNELSEIEQDHSSTTQSPYNTTSTDHGDHPLCCCHVIGFHLPHHLRLYRRLYSLVDHPCVSLYYPCKHHAYIHTTVPSGCSTGAATSFRRSLSSRHRYTITPASVHRFSIDSRTASCSKSLDTECDSGLTDISPGSNYCSIHQHTAAQSCLQQSAAKYRSQLTENRLIGTQRCRRNSDPESWQQFRNLQFSEPSLSIDMNENFDLNVSYDGEVNRTEALSNNSQSDQTDVSIRLSTFRSRDMKTLGSNLQFHGANHQYVTKLCNSAVDSNVDRNNIDYDLNSSSQQQQQFHFRPSLLLSAERSELPISSVMYTSDTCFSLRSNKSNAVNSSDISLCKPQTEMDNQSGLACQPLVWTGVSADDDANTSLKQPFMESNMKVKGNTVQCSNEANYLTITDMSHHVNSNNKPQLVSDVSVNELASYMEHMVHIPGRMSEMAQRMYL
ncbi:hypothetical protein Smp_132120 [Schistosoma mansoni]|uniref:hypothetical protein n=1 Tax=Schistosoma mansoni TaxID=6183 RepID=UPI0001A63A00|nr:hypothetical protein Smp_132120 [Schistosoma mansoni]|eukprot:XP_018654879.1 hypothetical protein Smp_132120 [Schistosoma mansoni]